MRGAIAGLVVLAAGVAGALGQGVEACPRGDLGFEDAIFPSAIKGVPYTATMVAVREQRLIDGNVIQRAMRTQQARSSTGSTRTEYGRGCLPGEDGAMHLSTYVSLWDVERGVTSTWYVNNAMPKQVMEFPRSSMATTPHVTTAEEKAAEELRMKLNRLQQIPPSEYKQADLGMRNIAGVEARGMKITRTIPAGEEGNTLPLVVVTERWYSDKMKMTMMQSTDDPRTGKRTAELEDVVLGEPDAKLFAVPEGYVLRERKPQ